MKGGSFLIFVEMAVFCMSFLCCRVRLKRLKWKIRSSVWIAQEWEGVYWVQL